MVCFHCSITVDQQIIMSKSVNSTELSSKLRNKKSPNSPNHLSIPACQQSRSAAIDVVIFISVIGACGFLLFSLFPYIKLLISNTIKIFGEVAYLFREEVIRTPWVYGCFGLSMLCAVTAMLAITVCTFTKCGKPGCRGLRNAAEFDIQIETEECVKNLAKDVMKKGLFELPRDHHRELEAELKKMAPPNGRAVLVFRSRCGCSVGRMEVSGPKKLRKVKK